MNRTETTFGTRLRATRKNRGLGPDALATAATNHGTNWTAGGVGQTERGETYPRDELLLTIGDILNPTLEELPEVYLARARRELDPQQVGLKRALARYHQLNT